LGAPALRWRDSRHRASAEARRRRSLHLEHGARGRRAVGAQAQSGLPGASSVPRRVSADSRGPGLTLLSPHHRNTKLGRLSTDCVSGRRPSRRKPTPRPSPRPSTARSSTSCGARARSPSNAPSQRATSPDCPITRRPPSGPSLSACWTRGRAWSGSTRPRAPTATTRGSATLTRPKLSSCARPLDGCGAVSRGSA
jgi:hypothetical protein